MNIRFFSSLSPSIILKTSLLALLLAACAPAAVPAEPSAGQPAAPAVVTEPSATATLGAAEGLPVDEPTLAPSTQAVIAPTETMTPLPIATSRGPNLHATDPRTVTLASGDLQFVEFIRFT